jgi:PIF1-like helicase
MDTAHINSEFFNGRAILAVHHDIMREINAIIIRRIPREIKMQLAVDRIVHYKNGNNPEEDIRREVINILNPRSLPPAELELKVGVPVILLRNFNTVMGFCNGARMIVKAIRRDFLKCTLLRGDHKGTIHVISRCKLN